MRSGQVRSNTSMHVDKTRRGEERRGQCYGPTSGLGFCMH